VRNYAPTAHQIALAPALFRVRAVWIAPLAQVLETWAVVYFVTGTLSLFGDVISRTLDSRAIVFPSDPAIQKHRP
jgi:hypothetical protein